MTENEQELDATEQEEAPIVGHEELYKEFLAGLEDAAKDRKEAAHDSSEANELLDIDDPNELYKKAFDSWKPEEPQDVERFEADATPEEITAYVSENWDYFQNTVFSGLPEITRQETPNFLALFESYSRDTDIHTAATRARDVLLSAREGRDISMHLVQVGLRQMDRRRDSRGESASTEETQEDD